MQQRVLTAEKQFQKVPWDEASAQKKHLLTEDHHILFLGEDVIAGVSDLGKVLSGCHGTAGTGYQL